MLRRGRKSAAQTPAPAKDRIYGSKTNPKGSASSEKSAKAITLSDKTMKSLQDKLKEFKEKHPSKKNITLNDLKAVYRRGLGAYSSTHRPTITGGVPNTRNAWAMARVNKFLLKAGGTKVKAAYVQDDDLMKFEDGGKIKPEISKIIKDLISEWDMDACEINKGECYVFADALESKLKQNGYSAEFLSNDFFYNTASEEAKHDNFSWYKEEDYNSKKPNNFNWKGYHAWVFVDGKHYDSETTEGVVNFYNLPIFKKFVDGGLIAPNGKPSNLTPEQYKLVRTPKFKAWFGDWENDPKNASKVVDENGEPFVLYRGTTLNTQNVSGFWLTKNKSYAENFGEVNDYFAKIKRPMPEDEFDRTWLVDFDKYDGRLGDFHKLVVKEPNQIKLADGTNTTFDAENPDISFADGGTFNDAELLRKYKSGKSIGFTGIAHLKAKGLIPRVDGTKRKSNKYKEDGGSIDKEIMLPDLNLSYGSLKKTLNMQGYEIEPMRQQEVGKLAKGMSVQQIAQHHNTTVENIQEQLDKGTNVEMEHTDNQDIARAIALDHVYESPVYYDKLATIEEEFKDGGVVIGKRHSEYDENGSGEKFLVESTGQVVELEGGEGVLCQESMSSDKKFNFDGKSMTGREIASYLNHKYGGVEFAKGGEVDKKIDKIIANKHVCGCKHQYYHGGELPTAVVKNLKGGEAVVTVKSMESQDKYYFNGRSMTPRQIFSSINLASGGKKFEDGGTIDLKSIRMETETQLAKMMYYVSTLNGLIPSSKKEMLWQSIKDKFSEVFYADTDDEKNEIFSNDVKAEEHVWMFDRYSPYPSTLSWADAKSLFLRKLTKEEKDIITIEYDVRNISEAFGLMWEKKILVKLN